MGLWGGRVGVGWAARRQWPKPKARRPRPAAPSHPSALLSTARSSPIPSNPAHATPVGIALAERDGVDWVLHIDTDELMYPGSGPTYSLQAVLAAYPESVDTVVFPNYEALPETDDVSAPFEQVTLFKRNYLHVLSDAYFRSYHAVARGNPNYFITYGNGKSAARVRPGLRPNGAHRWYSYAHAPKEETSDQSAVLHYTYTRHDILGSWELGWGGREGWWLSRVGDWLTRVGEAEQGWRAGRGGGRPLSLPSAPPQPPASRAMHTPFTPLLTLAHTPPLSSQVRRPQVAARPLRLRADRGRRQALLHPAL